MANENESKHSEQDLSIGELVNQESLEPVDDPAVRLAGYNQIPDFGEDTKGTLQETNNDSENK